MNGTSKRATEIRAVIYIAYETALGSMLADLATGITVVVVIGTGWFLDSVPMQWMGFLFLIIAGVGRAIRAKRYSIEEARHRLDEIERDIMRRRA